MLRDLPKNERLLLLKFVCAFAWADLEVRDEERSFIAGLVQNMDLDEDEIHKVKQWLKVPPKPDEIDPNKVPHKHRQLFLDAARAVIGSDGEIAEEERENYELLEQLTR